MARPDVPRTLPRSTCLGLTLTLAMAAGARAGDDPSWLARQRRESLNRCGANCLQLTARYLGRPCGRAQINRLLPPSGEESDLRSIKGAAERLGLRTLAVHWQTMPPMLTAPLIIRIEDPRRDERHFVTLLTREGSKVLVADVPHSPVWVELDKFIERTRWDGRGLYVAPGELSLLPVRLALHRPALLALSALAAAGLVAALLRRFLRARRGLAFGTTASTPAPGAKVC